MEDNYNSRDNSDSLSTEGFEDEVWDSNSRTSSEDNLSWIAWYCAHIGHEYFTEVPEEFILEDFNMTGLSAMVPHYDAALELILDLEPEEDADYSPADQTLIEAAAEMLYGLIHQRYITSREGLQTMADKYNEGHFGICPRTLCQKAGVLPVGLSDLMNCETVKLFCPVCLDIYSPPNSRFSAIDGGFFGTTFPHLFFMTFTDLKLRHLKKVVECYVPKIYGFKVWNSAESGPRMAWLREMLNCLPQPKGDTGEDPNTSDLQDDYIGNAPEEPRVQDVDADDHMMHSPSMDELQKESGRSRVVANESTTADGNRFIDVEKSKPINEIVAVKQVNGTD